MKKRLTSISIVIMMLCAAATFTAFDQQEKNKKDQQENKGKGKGNNQNKPAKAEKGNAQSNNNKGNQDQKNDQANNKGGNKGNGNVNSKGNDDYKDRGNSDKNKKEVAVNGYNWDTETFKERKKIRNQEKVTLCHKFNRSGEPGVTINVSANALKAHLDHGDVRGDCPDIDNTRYSDIFLDRRRDYYNDLQAGQEQVLYSRSILDYALERLSGARLQLITLQQANAPQAEIDSRRVAVVELEQNVSTLEILLGTAVNILANKLQ